jgi:F-type H+-transporting ATPase subunit gamma
LLIEKGLTPQGVFFVPNSVDNIINLVEKILSVSEEHSHISELYLINHRLDGGVYHPISLRLLPLDKIWKERIQKIPWPSKNLPEVMGEDTFKALIREYLFIHLFRASAESLAAENTSRLRAMERADKNISELLEDLTGEFTHMRQTQIDEELFDVVSSFETITNKGLSE